MIALKTHRLAGIFPARIASTNPRVVYAYPSRDQTLYREEEMSGFFYLVFPKDGREHLFIRSLLHGVDKFAPANGGGVLVRAHLLPALNQ